MNAGPLPATARLIVPHVAWGGTVIGRETYRR